MGAVCKSNNCVKPLPLYKQVLSEIFNLEQEANQNNASQTQVELNSFESTLNPAEILNRVKGRISALIEYLHNNKTKLKDVGNQIEKIVTSSRNPQTYLVALFTIDELLNHMKKFKYDGKDLRKMISFKERGEGHFKQKLSDIVASEVQAQSSMENIILFENHVLEILLSSLHNQNHFRHILYKYTIKTVNLFFATQSPLERALEKIERLVLEILELFKEKVSVIKTCEEPEYQMRLSTLEAFQVIVSKASSDKIVKCIIEMAFLNLAFTYFEGEHPADGLSEEKKAFSEQLNTLSLQLIETAVKASVESNHLVETIALLLSQFEQYKWHLGVQPVNIMKQMILYLRGTRLSRDIDTDVLKTLIDIELTSHERRSISVTSKSNMIILVSELLNTIPKASWTNLFLERLLIYLLTNFRLADGMEDSIMYRTKVEETVKVVLRMAEGSSAHLAHLIKTMAQFIEEQVKENVPVQPSLQFFLFLLSNIVSFPSFAGVPEEAIRTLIKICLEQSYSSLSFKILYRLLELQHSDASMGTSGRPATNSSSGLLSVSPFMAKQLLGTILLYIFQKQKNTFESMDKAVLEDFYVGLLYTTKILGALIQRKDKAILALVIAFLMKSLETFADKDTTTVYYYNTLVCFVITILKRISVLLQFKEILQMINGVDHELTAQSAYSNMRAFLSEAEPVNITTVLSHRDRFIFQEKVLSKDAIIPLLKEKVGSFFGNPEFFAASNFGTEFNNLNQFGPEHESKEDLLSNVGEIPERPSQKKLSFVIQSPKNLSPPGEVGNAGRSSQAVDEESFEEIAATLRNKDKKLANLMNVIRNDENF